MGRLCILAALFVACMLAGIGLAYVITDGIWQSANHRIEAQLAVFVYMLLGATVSFGITLYAWGEHEDVRFMDKKPGTNALEPLGRWMYEGGNWRKVAAWAVSTLIVGAFILGLTMIIFVALHRIF